MEIPSLIQIPVKKQNSVSPVILLQRLVGMKVKVGLEAMCLATEDYELKLRSF